MSRIPVVLVTGFLGSGKTTLLRELALSHPEWRLVFLVNEYADTSVDGEMLASTGSPTQSVVGGSLFCECKAGDFIRTMREEVYRYHLASPLDAVIIETSGTADPDAIGKLMTAHGLSGNFQLRSILTVVAPAKLNRLLGNLPVVEAQIQSSDWIVINKTDTADEETLARTEASIRALNPTARLVRAVQCRFDFVLPERSPAVPQGELSTCDANPFTTVETVWPQTHSVDRAKDWLTALPETILRVKGRISTPEGDWHVERTVDSLQIDPTNSGLSRIVLIAHDDHEEDLHKAIKSMPAASAPQTGHLNS
jgi:G3E family GTPase